MTTKIRLVIVGIEGNVNLGFIARLAMNFSVDEVYLVSPKASPYSDEAQRYAARAKEVLKRLIIVEKLEDALKDVELSVCTTAKTGYKTDVLRNVMSLEDALQLILSYRSISIVFGRESVGLTREELSKCDIIITIPANPEYPTLNLSHAVAIVLYRLWIAKNKATRIYETASAEQLNRVKSLARSIAELVTDPNRREQAVIAITRCIAKARLTTSEASALYHLFKKVYVLLKRSLS
ncbi:MAG: TrmH family RNA methyltransferase [Pyrodictiaceae archaeon]